MRKKGIIVSEDAMAKELEALDDNHTRNLVKLPNWKKLITFCWVYKVKYKSDGSLEKCKARLVAKGFNQKGRCWLSWDFFPCAKVQLNTMFGLSCLKEMEYPFTFWQ